MFSPSYIILRIQIQGSKQCRSRWGGSLWATSSRSTLFANSDIFVSGTEELITGIALKQEHFLLQYRNSSKWCRWNGKQNRPCLGCSFGSSLIWVCIVCSNLSVPILKLFRIYSIMNFSIVFCLFALIAAAVCEWFNLHFSTTFKPVLWSHPREGQKLAA